VETSVTSNSIDFERLYNNIESGRSLRYHRQSGFTFTHLMLSIQSAMVCENFSVGFVVPNRVMFKHTTQMIADIFEMMKSYDMVDRIIPGLVRMKNGSTIRIINVEEAGHEVRGLRFDRLEFDVDLPFSTAKEDLYYTLMAHLKE
jgi:hypothetical protein